MSAPPSAAPGAAPPVTPLQLPPHPSATGPDSLRPECMQVIAQGVPGAHPLATEPATALAGDTEHFLRSVLATSLKFMNHSRSRVLTVSHIASALRLHAGEAPVGQRAPAAFHALPFARVLPGVHVRGDRVVRLRAAWEAPLPGRAPGPAPRAAWLRRPRAAPPAALAAAAAALDGNGDPAPLLAALRVSRDAGAGAAAILRLAAGRVHAAARPGGDATAIARAVAVADAVLRNPWHAGGGLDAAARILLTALVGRTPVATEAAGRTRRMAADALRAALAAFEAPLFRARVLKTLVAALTDDRAPLESVYGAVLGLAAAGRQVCSLLLDPHLPVLFRALEVANAAAEKIPHPEAAAVRECVSRMCELIAATKDTASSPLSLAGADDAAPVVQDQPVAAS